MIKKIHSFRLFTIFVLSFLCGIFFASFFKIDFQISSFLLLFAIIALLITALFNTVFKNYVLVITSISLAAFFSAPLYYSFFSYKTSVILPYGQEVKITGQIIKNPEVDFKAQKVAVEVLESNAPNIKDSKLLVSLPHYPRYKYADEISFTVNIEKPGVIEGFDYGKYLKRWLVFGTVNQPKEIQLLNTKLSWSEKSIRSLYSVSAAFENSLNNLLPEPHASLAAGLILGSKRNMPADFKDALSNTGLTHIIALSGYNVTIILYVISILLLGVLNRKQVFWVGFFLVLLFVILTGAASSVVRAAIFSMLVIFGKTIGRRADFINLMLLAALIMIIINPFVLISDIGFQLSFLAFSGLIFISPIMEKILQKKKYQNIPAFIKDPLAETLSAQIAVFPIILVVFGKISLLSPFANVLVLWLVPYAMLFSFFTGLLGIIWLPLGKISLIFLWPCLEFIIKSVKLVSAFPLSSLEVKKGIIPIEVILFAVIFFCVYWLKQPKHTS